MPQNDNPSNNPAFQDTREPLQRREQPWTYEEARRYANDQARRERAQEGMEGRQTQAGHTVAARHVPESGIQKDDYDKQQMMHLDSRAATFREENGQKILVNGAEVTHQDGSVTYHSFHRAQELMIDHAVNQSRNGQGELTPQGHLDAGEQVLRQAQNIPMDQRVRDQIYKETVQMTGLVDSYNTNHPENPILARGAVGSEIGGVGNKVGIIAGLKDSVAHVLEDQNIFVLPTIDGKPPFSNEQLQQIMRELAIGIYVYDTVPFFSLHFNSNGTMFPVIHPVYKDTLIGQVLGMLDYYMKGFLNGGFFTENYINTWLKNPTNASVNDVKQAINIERYCKEHIGSDVIYKSLRELMADNNISEMHSVGADAEGQSIYKAKFRTSFRIIAKQNSIKKTNDVFELDPDFDVEYTIECMPEYETYLQKYRSEHGHDPEDWKKLNEIYAAMAAMIKNLMPKMPICREYFAMLGAINFFTYYFKTLKAMQKVPQLPPLNKKTYNFPPLLPPLPTRYPKSTVLKMRVNDLVVSLTPQQKKQLIDAIRLIAEREKFDLLAFKDETIDLPEIAEKLGKFVNIIINKIDPEVLQQLKQKFLQLHKKSFINEPTNKELELVVALPILFIMQQIKHYPEERAARLKEHENLKSLMYTRYREDLEEFKREVNKQRNIFEQKLQDNFKMIINQLTQQKQSAKNALMQGMIISDPETNNPLTSTYAIDNWYNEKIRRKNELLQTERNHLNTEIRQRQADLEQYWQKKFSEFDDARNQELQQLEQIYRNPFSNQKFLEQTLPIPIGGTVLEIPDASYYQDSNRNFRIFGGCGLQLPELTTVYSKIGQELAEHSIAEIENARPESFAEININQTKMFAFKLNNQNYAACTSVDYLWLERSLRTETTPSNEALRYLHAVIRGDLLTLQQKFKKEYLAIKDSKGASLLHYAVSAKNAQVVEFLLNKGLSPLLVDQDNLTPLHIAAENGADQILAMLIKKTSGRQRDNLINTRMENGVTALYLAVMQGHEHNVDILLKAGANVNVKLTNDMTVLYSAFHNGKEKCALKLLECKEIRVDEALEDGTTPLYVAAETGQLNGVKKLLICGANVNLARRDKMRPLHTAVKNRQKAIVELLLTVQTIEVNCQLDSGITPLHIAAQEGCTEIVTLLLKHGANTNLTGWEKSTPLMLALEHGQLETAMQLIPHSDITLQNAHKQTAYQLAARLGLFSLIDAMRLSEKQIVDADQYGYSVLHYLIINGQYDQFEKYFNRLTLTQQNKLKKDTELAELALRFGQPQIVAYLKEHGFNFKLITKDSWHPIHFAAKFGYMEILRSDYAESNIPLINGKSLAYLAAEAGQLEALKWLLAKNPKLTCEAGHILLAATQNGQLEVIDYLLSQLANPNVITDADKNTFVHKVAYLGDPKLLEFLRQRGADFSERNIKGETAFHIVIENDFAKAWEYLTDDKKPLPLPDDIIYFLAQKGLNEKLIQQLKSHEKLLNYQDANTGESVLHAAVHSRDVTTVALLAKYQQLLTVKDKQGHTPLSLAIQNGDVACAEVLLAKGADPNIEVQGKKLIHLAFASKSLAMMAWLPKQGFYLEQRDKQDHYATKQKAFFENLADLPVKLRAYVQAVNQDNLDKAKSIAKELSWNFYYPIKLDLPFEKLDGEYSLIDIPILLGKPELIAWFIQEGFPLDLANSQGLTPLHNLIKCQKMLTYQHGKKDFVATIINSYFNDKNHKARDIKTLEGLSLPHVAAAQGQIQILDALNRRRVNMLTKTSNGVTPVHLAAISGNYEVIEWYIKHGYDVDLVDHHNMTPLAYAIAGNYKHIAEILCQHGVQLNRRVSEEQYGYVHLAVIQKQVELTLMLVQFGVPISLPDQNGCLPIHLAAKNGLPELVNFLAYRLPDIDVTDLNGNTPLFYAALSGNPRATQLLLELGAEVDGIEKDSQAQINDKLPVETPLQMALLFKRIRNAEQLLRAGANTSAKEDDGKLSVFNYLVRGGSLELLSKAKQNGILKPDTDVRPAIVIGAQSDLVPPLQYLHDELKLKLDGCLEDGTTALHSASRAGASRTVKYLLDQRVLPTTTNSRNEKPIHLAIKHGHISEVQLLIPHSKLDEVDALGNSFLHLAANSGNTAMVILLIKLGVPLNNINKHQQTALHLAAQHTPDAIPYLLAAGANPTIKNAEQQLANQLLSSTQQDVQSLLQLYQAAWNKEGEKELLLHRAIRLQNTKGFKFIARFLNLGKADADGNTAAHVAVINKALGALRELKRHRCNFNIENKAGLTPFILALMYADVSDLEKFLQHGLSINDFNKNGLNPLFICYREGLTTKFNWLARRLIYTAKQKQLPASVKVAVQTGDINGFFRSIYEGLDINAVKQQLLHVIVEHDSAEFLQLILKWFVANNIINIDTTSLLSDVLTQNKLKMAEVLIKQGNTLPKGALVIALEHQNLYIVNMLKEKGAILEIEEIRAAILNNNVKLLTGMLLNGWRLDNPNDPLWEALQKEKCQKSFSVIANFVNHNSANNNLKPPVKNMISKLQGICLNAVQNNNLVILKNLQRCPAIYHVKCRNESLIHLAIHHNHWEIVNLLCEDPWHIQAAQSSLIERVLQTGDSSKVQTLLSFYPPKVAIDENDCLRLCNIIGKDDANSFCRFVDQKFYINETITVNKSSVKLIDYMIYLAIKNNSLTIFKYLTLMVSNIEKHYLTNNNVSVLESILLNDKQELAVYLKSQLGEDYFAEAMAIARAYLTSTNLNDGHRKVLDSLILEFKSYERQSEHARRTLYANLYPLMELALKNNHQYSFIKLLNNFFIGYVQLSWFKDVSHNENMFVFLIKSMGNLASKPSSDNKFPYWQEAAINYTTGTLLLHLAIELDFTKAVSYLVTQPGVNLNARIDGKTALHRVIAKNSDNSKLMFMQLLKAGANPFIVDNHFTTVADLIPKSSLTDTIAQSRNTIFTKTKKTPEKNVETVPSLIRSLQILKEHPIAASYLIDEYYKTKQEKAKKRKISFFEKSYLTRKHKKIDDAIGYLDYQTQQTLQLYIQNSKFGGN